MSDKNEFSVGIKNYLEAKVEFSPEAVISAKGSLVFLKGVGDIRSKLKKNEKLELFKVSSSEDIVLNELILKLNKEWDFP